MTCQSKEDAMDIDVSKATNGHCSVIKKNGLLLYPVAPKVGGEGLPYAPINWPNPGDTWSWRVGKRTSVSGYYVDRYLYPPSRLQKSRQGKESFKSKLSVQEYIQALCPNVDVEAFFASFSWKVPSKQAFLLGEHHDATCMLSEEMTEESLSDYQNGDPACKAGNRFCRCLTEEANVQPVNTMFCDICCTEANFCRDCCCILCCKTIDLALGGYSFIRCEAEVHDGLICGHSAHLVCASRCYMAGTVGGTIGLDAEYYCRRCDSKTGLVEHVTKILKTCESVESPGDVKKMLDLVVCLTRGSQKSDVKRLMNRAQRALQKFERGNAFSNIWEEEDDISTVKTVIRVPVEEIDMASRRVLAKVANLASASPKYADDIPGRPSRMIQGADGQSKIKAATFSIKESGASPIIPEAPISSKPLNAASTAPDAKTDAEFEANTQKAIKESLRTATVEADKKRKRTQGESTSKAPAALKKAPTTGAIKEDTEKEDPAVPPLIPKRRIGSSKGVARQEVLQDLTFTPPTPIAEGVQAGIASPLRSADQGALPQDSPVRTLQTHKVPAPVAANIPQGDISFEAFINEFQSFRARTQDGPACLGQTLKELHELRCEVSKLKENNARLKGENKAANAQDEELVKQNQLLVTEFKSKVKGFKKDLVDVSKTVTAQRDEIEALKTENSKLTDQITSGALQISDLESKLSQGTKALENSNTNLSRSIEEINLKEAELGHVLKQRDSLCLQVMKMQREVLPYPTKILRSFIQSPYSMRTARDAAIGQYHAGYDDCRALVEQEHNIKIPRAGAKPDDPNRFESLNFPTEFEWGVYKERQPLRIFLPFKSLAIDSTILCGAAQLAWEESEKSYKIRNEERCLDEIRRAVACEAELEDWDNTKQESEVKARFATVQEQEQGEIARRLEKTEQRLKQAGKTPINQWAASPSTSQ